MIKHEAPVDHAKVLERLTARTRHYVPGFGVGYKSESRWQRLVGVATWLFDGGRYAHELATTRYPLVLLPSREWHALSPERAWQVVAGELGNLLARHAEGWRWELSYVRASRREAAAIQSIQIQAAAIWWTGGGLYQTDADAIAHILGYNPGDEYARGVASRLIDEVVTDKVFSRPWGEQLPFRILAEALAQADALRRFPKVPEPPQAADE